MADAPGIRARNRAAIESEIMAVAGRHLAEYGAAALSLRAIARELGMVSSAVYRYLESRDELLTRLIIAAYDGLADQVEAALAEQAGDTSPVDRFRTIARATRNWARARPHEYALIYGSPVPGYRAPGERTNEAGTRVPRLLVATLAQFPHHPDSPTEESAFAGMLAAPAFEGSGLAAAALHRGLAAWTLVIGAISSEIFEQFGPRAYDPDAFFALILDDAEALVAR